MIDRIICILLSLLSVITGAFNLYNPGKSIDFKPGYEAVGRDMEKYCGIYSCVKDLGGVPALYVNGKPFTDAAYMTYLEEYADYDAFALAGYNLFSVPVLFAGRWISSTELFKPFHAGIFDEKGKADFTTLDNSINRILEACPDALIFPRVNVSMPLWWIEENPDLLDGTGVRESLYTEEFRQTAAGMLHEVIEHINQSDYAPHIVGYHIAGGNTEEWFHFDLNGGYGKAAEKAFNAYLDRYYPACGYSGLPDLSKLSGKNAYHKDEHLALFLEFASNEVADTVCFLCTEAKKATGNNVVVGAFYGYDLEVTSPLHGTHALRAVLDCDNIDFIVSPNSYAGVRDMNADWTEMFPADSVRLHGKLCMQECDIRTNLTKLLSERAPEYDPDKYMTAPVWHGLESEEQAVSMVRKSFCRQLIKGNGFTWFDMWGGWYGSETLMDEMSAFRRIAGEAMTKPQRRSRAEIAVFIDEGANKYMTDCALRNTASGERVQLGFMGAPYDIYDIADFEAVYKNYKGVIFLSELKTDLMKNALSLCKNGGTRYIAVSKAKKSFTAKELRAFCRGCGAHIYCESEDLVYICDGYAAIHSSTAGEKTIRLDRSRGYRSLLPGQAAEGRGDTITLTMGENETVLFELTD